MARILIPIVFAITIVALVAVAVVEYRKATSVRDYAPRNIPEGITVTSTALTWGLATDATVASKFYAHLDAEELAAIRAAVRQAIREEFRIEPKAGER